jgi:hypothetical protein
MDRTTSRAVGAGALGLIGLLALLLLAAWAVIARERGDGTLPGARGTPPLMLFTSLPIYWAEGADVVARLRSGEVHWARRELATGNALVPLDTLELDAAGGSGRLLMIQPRPLAPVENVALDRWVRGGGRVLLFADPALTADSLFPLGDPRRPQDTVLLSPILTRWGLDLSFDEAQPSGERGVGLGRGATLPVNLAGRFRAKGSGSCRTGPQGLVARCAVGRGRVTAVADAALFEPPADASDLAKRRRALRTLLAEAF